METLLSFEPKYHELTCRDGQPVWVPMYNPMRTCVSQEKLQLVAAGCQVEERLARLPKAVRRAAARTKRRERYSRWAPVLDPVLAVGMAIGAFAMFAQMSCLVGASLVNAYDPVWFKGLTQVETLAISAAAGLPIVGVIVGVLSRSWWRCANAH